MKSKEEIKALANKAAIDYGETLHEPTNGEVGAYLDGYTKGYEHGISDQSSPARFVGDDWIKTESEKYALVYPDINPPMFNTQYANDFKSGAERMRDQIFSSPPEAIRTPHEILMELTGYSASQLSQSKIHFDTAMRAIKIYHDQFRTVRSDQGGMEWISVGQPPKEDEWVLVYNGHWTGVGKYNTKQEDAPVWAHWQDETLEWIGPIPTHWMPLPSPPNHLRTAGDGEKG